MVLKVETIAGAHVVTGKTFEVKHILKRHGARWDAFRAGWRFEDEGTAAVAAEEASAQLAVLQELAALESGGGGISGGNPGSARAGI